MEAYYFGQAIVSTAIYVGLLYGLRKVLTLTYKKIGVQ